MYTNLTNICNVNTKRHNTDKDKQKKLINKSFIIYYLIGKNAVKFLNYI